MVFVESPTARAARPTRIQQLGSFQRRGSAPASVLAGAPRDATCGFLRVRARRAPRGWFSVPDRDPSNSDFGSATLRNPQVRPVARRLNLLKPQVSTCDFRPMRGPAVLPPRPSSDDLFLLQPTTPPRACQGFAECFFQGGERRRASGTADEADRGDRPRHRGPDRRRGGRQ